MPKQQAHPGEAAAQSTSKNAKEKSNSATLRACQGGVHRETPAGGDLEKDSEKDSGYSEAGSDDQRSSKSEPHRGNGKSSTNKNMAPYEELTPVYVFKNLLVKPSGPEPLMSWAGGWHGLGAGKAATQVLLIQQPVMPAPPTPTPPSCPAPRQPSGKKAGSCSNKSSYLPILNSYPRIAPHPRKDNGGVKGSVWGGGSEGQSQSKRVCTEEEKREAGSVMGALLRRQQGGARGGYFPSSPSSSSTSCWQSSAPDSVGSPSISSSQTPSPPSSWAPSPGRPLPDSTSHRQRRFLNTADILQQSGLLAITLRTKELLKQSAAAERELLQLRQHTHVLCNIAQAGQSGLGGGEVHDLNKLFLDMEKSGSYPDLDLHHLKALSGSRPRAEEEEKKARWTVFLSNMDDGTSPPSPLFAPSPEPVSTSVPDRVLDRPLA